MLAQLTACLLAPHLPISEKELASAIEIPPRPELGDAAFPCFTLAKTMRQSPQSIAERTADAVNGTDEGVRAETAGGYLNLFFDPAVWGNRILTRVMAGDYGRLQDGQGRRVVIDMSSPNIAKPFGIGHLRSTMIGNALANVYQAAGYRVTRVNHLGDWGTQFGKLIAAYRRWGDRALLEAEPIRESLRLYVKFHEEAESNPELEDEAREWFRKLETGDGETRGLWRFFVDESLKEFDRVYARLGVRFDLVLGESFYNDKMEAVVDRLTELSLLEESDGAQVVRLEELGMPPCLILKSDGTTIYPIRDLATAVYRKKQLGADLLLYVVGAEQTLHFQQVFAVLGKMGEAWHADCRHVPFGLMKFEGKKMSTRRGKVVFLDEVLDEAAAKALQVIEAKNPELENKRETAEAIGVGAIVFADLRNRRQLSVDFQLEEAIGFEGETGPYLQYTYARILSLLRKGKYEEFAARGKAAEGRHMSSPAAWACLKTASRFEESILQAVRENEPSVIGRYLLELAKDFNRYYNEGKMLTEDGEETFGKLSVAAACAKVLKQGLQLLGIRTPERI
ncbi:arginine--tRNA ligase [Cohnella sp. CFH 77786]|uniref:arginine--tRNA ligase n=1 Tax=Cohnella sp. CFH 77786 TaxID=2662265 RepID=UPI001C60ADD1|nr:arginine--tRNA ligase [Cohnella sp. CFH 77786]MBW5448689.1 arginine--tRNA ligase [Cohnella sp. CFH 77786]